MPADYKVMLNNGSMVTIAAAERVEKDGAGLRFWDADSNVIASFGDGQFAAHFPAAAPMTDPEPPVSD